MEGALRQAGYRLTPHRRAILIHLAATDNHPSARMIFEAVRQSHPGLSRATVYNTLGLLVRLGQIKVLEFDLDNRHETNLRLHVNLICTECSNIQDFEGNLPAPDEMLLTEQGFLVLDHRLEYYGICLECRTAGNSPPPNLTPRRETPPGGE